MKEAAAWLSGTACRRARPLLPRRPGAARAAAGAQARRAGPGAARGDAPPARRAAARGLARAHGSAVPARRAVPRALPRRAAARAAASTSTPRSARCSRVDQAVAFLALLELRKTGEICARAGRPVHPHKGFSSRQRKRYRMDRPLRLITANPVDQLARTRRGAARRRLRAAVGRGAGAGRRRRRGAGRARAGTPLGSLP